MKPVQYLIKHEEVKPHQKHDSHPILVNYGSDQLSIRINDQGNDIVVKPLNSFSVKSVTIFKQNPKHLQRSITNLSINNLYNYSMIPILQLMSKNIYTLESQNTIQLLLQINFPRRNLLYYNKTKVH